MLLLFTFILSVNALQKTFSTKETKSTKVINNITNTTQMSSPTFDDFFSLELRRCKKKYKNWAENRKGLKPELKCCEQVLTNYCLHHKCETTLFGFVECHNISQYFSIKETCVEYKLSEEKCNKNYTKKMNWVLIASLVVFFLGMLIIVAIFLGFYLDRGGALKNETKHESEIVPASTVYDSKAGDQTDRVAFVSSLVKSSACSSIASSFVPSNVSYNEKVAPKKDSIKKSLEKNMKIDVGNFNLDKKSVTKISLTKSVNKNDSQKMIPKV